MRERESEALGAFSEPVRRWFLERFGRPTPPQEKGWPPIQRGENTLILSPTGSGKTLAAFLWEIDRLITELSGGWFDELRLVYVSPLKALNNDIERNLREPLRGIQLTALRLGLAVPKPRVAIRSGDTPPRERKAIFAKPPHVLITTPESLYLMLTHPKAPLLFRTVRTVIVDEIHALAGNKRGAHLALSLERLERLSGKGVQRIGLSATIRPLQEVAHFLGGNEWRDGTEGPELIPRPVTLVDAGCAKQLDLLVESPAGDPSVGPGSVWLPILERLAQLIRSHRTTLIFVNNRRTAERVAEKLNEILSSPEGDVRAILADGVPKGLGYFAAGGGEAPRLVGVHHGSLSRDERLRVEEDLKSGRLRAIVGTSSLELGIDIGTIDLVVQVESPKSVAQGLQRVGRSGHLVGMTSRGRIFPMHPEDALEAAVVASGMLKNEVEPTHILRNPLDVLAQQIVSMVSVEDWDAEELFRLVRQSAPYESLSHYTFETVLAMLAGRYRSALYRELRPRILWDRQTQRLTALPGARTQALINGGTIPDQGTYGVYLADGKTKLGELDEEFVFETRVGDTFLLGSQVWRVTEIADDRLLVTEAPGSMARMPFWRGDYPWRPLATGKKVGELRRKLGKALTELRRELRCSTNEEVLDHAEHPRLRKLVAEMQTLYALDEVTVRSILTHLAKQLDSCGRVTSDRSVLIESFEDALGDLHVVIHSCFGGRVNGAWALSLRSRLRDLLGVEPEIIWNDDAILLRLPPMESAVPFGFVASLRAEEARERILRELPHSAAFGARFRQNAARALLLPGMPRRRRTPFWLQRLRAKDLLEAVRGQPDFPIFAETLRDCLQEVLDLRGLETVLEGIQRGEIELASLEWKTPSPLARRLLWTFTSVYLYEWDEPKGDRALPPTPVSKELLSDLLSTDELLRSLHPQAVERVRQRARGLDPAGGPRSPEEMALLFQRLGDLTEQEALACSPEHGRAWLQSLLEGGQIVRTRIPTARGSEERYVCAEYLDDYRAAFQPGGEESRKRILARFLETSGPVSEDEIRERYDFPAPWLAEYLRTCTEQGKLIRGRFEHSGDRYCDRDLLRAMHRISLSIRRGEIEPVPLHCYLQFLTEWHHFRQGPQRIGRQGLIEALRQLEGYLAPFPLWEGSFCPLRVAGFDANLLDELVQSGEFLWLALAEPGTRTPSVSFLERGHILPLGSPEAEANLSPAESEILIILRSHGASFASEIVRLAALPETEVNEALGNLVLRGLVTNDSLFALRQLLGRWQRQGAEAQTAPDSSYGRLPAGMLCRAGYREAKRRARQRVAHLLRQRATVGRWSAVCRASERSAPGDPGEIWARVLLRRYGVVTREWLPFEPLVPDATAVWNALRKLELRGEVRGGYFIQGLRGGQFALPEAAETLQRLRLQSASPCEEEPTVMNALDPACVPLHAAPASLQVLEQRPLPIARRESTWVVLHRGIPTLAAQDNGRRMATALPVDSPLLSRSLRALLRHLARTQRRITVEQWNGRLAVGGEVEEVLRSLGFFREPRRLTWEREPS